MKNFTATHFIRKSSQLRASFIQNQILFHNRYSPQIVYKNLSEIDDGGFAHFDNSHKIPILSLNKETSSLSKLKYKFFKLISINDKKKIVDYIKNSDVLHFHYGTDAGIYLPLLKDVKIPKVVSFYGYDCSSFHKKFLGLGQIYLKKRVFKYVDKIFAMSEDMKKDLITAGCPKEKIIVHYHGIGTQRFYEAHTYGDTKHINFLSISGFEPKKGHIFLLKSFKKSFNKNSNIHLTIVGEGPLRENISDFIKHNNMNSYVTLKNKTVYASDEHLSYLRNADVFIHPSVTDVNGDKEGIPGAIVEAMAAGLPVISTLHAGIPYIIKNNETGLLSEEWDVDVLSEKIIKLSNDVKLRKKLGKSGQEYAINALDLNIKEIELEKIYESLLQRN